MGKIQNASQITKAKISPTDICFFGHLGQIHPLMPTQMTADLSIENNDRFMFHILVHTTKKSFLLL